MDLGHIIFFYLQSDSGTIWVFVSKGRTNNGWEWPIMAFTGALFSCCNAKGWWHIQKASVGLTEFPVRD